MLSVSSSYLLYLHHHTNIECTKSLLEGNKLKALKHNLKELSSLNINPVTIPNLLYQYYTKAQLAEYESLFG